MIHWEVEPHIRTMVCPPDELLKFPSEMLHFGPVCVCTHRLADAGWELGMVQRTPMNMRKTRPKIWLAPPGNRSQGFRIKPRSRNPYCNPGEVFDDLVMFGRNAHPDVEMTLSKFETKTITREVVKVVEVPVAAEVVNPVLMDPFPGLKSWCDQMVASMELPVPKSHSTYTDDDPSTTNVINLIDHLRRRDPAVADEELEARLTALFA